MPRKGDRVHRKHFENERFFGNDYEDDRTPDEHLWFHLSQTQVDLKEAMNHLATILRHADDSKLKVAVLSIEHRLQEASLAVNALMMKLEEE